MSGSQNFFYVVKTFAQGGALVSSAPAKIQVHQPKNSKNNIISLLFRADNVVLAVLCGL